MPIFLSWVEGHREKRRTRRPLGFPGKSIDSCRILCSVRDSSIRVLFWFLEGFQFSLDISFFTGFLVRPRISFLWFFGFLMKFHGFWYLGLFRVLSFLEWVYSLIELLFECIVLVISSRVLGFTCLHLLNEDFVCVGFFWLDSVSLMLVWGCFAFRVHPSWSVIWMMVLGYCITEKKYPGFWLIWFADSILCRS